MNQVARNTQLRVAQLSRDCGSPAAREGMSADDLYKHLTGEGCPAWVADAMVEAACNDDFRFVKNQVERHVPGWVRT